MTLNSLFRIELIVTFFRWDRTWRFKHISTFHIRRFARYERVDTRLTSDVAILRIRVLIIFALESIDIVAVHVISVVKDDVIIIEALLHVLDVVWACVDDVDVVLTEDSVNVDVLNSFEVFNDSELKRDDVDEESDESEKKMNHCEKRVMKTLELYLKARCTTTTTSSTE